MTLFEVVAILIALKQDKFINMKIIYFFAYNTFQKSPSARGTLFSALQNSFTFNSGGPRLPDLAKLWFSN